MKYLTISLLSVVLVFGCKKKSGEIIIKDGDIYIKNNSFNEKITFTIEITRTLINEKNDFCYANNFKKIKIEKETLNPGEEKYLCHQYYGYYGACNYNSTAIVTGELIEKK